MTFGRPGSIPGHYVKLTTPSHLIPTGQSNETVAWSDTESSTEFFNATVLVNVCPLTICALRLLISSFILQYPIQDHVPSS